MESKIREVVLSDIASKSMEQIYDYGVETFALTAATIFIEELYNKIYQLSGEYHYTRNVDFWLPNPKNTEV